MADVSFSFKPEVSEGAQETLGEELNGLAGVTSVERTKPDARSPVARRYWHATTVDAETAARLVDTLRSAEEIDAAGVPGVRGLP